jgi:hypothetical protein
MSYPIAPQETTKNRSGLAAPDRLMAALGGNFGGLFAPARYCTFPLSNSSRTVRYSDSAFNSFSE